jgi:hypothetical protein
MIKVNIKIKDDKYLRIEGVIHKRQVYLATGHTGARPCDPRCSGPACPDRGLTQRRWQWWHEAVVERDGWVGSTMQWQGRHRVIGAAVEGGGGDVELRVRGLSWCVGGHHR